MHLGDEILQHRLGDFKIRNDSILHGTDRHNAAWGAPQHALGRRANGQYLLGVAMHSDHGRFTQHHPFPSNIDQGVGGPEVNSQIGRKESV